MIIDIQSMHGVQSSGVLNIYFYIINNISTNRCCVNKTKRNGPKTEPWGLPKPREALFDLMPLIVTV